MEYTVIEAGYRITVESYENDGDYASTETVDGLDKSQAAFAVDILRLFEGKFGNLYSISKSERLELANEVYEIMQEHPASTTYMDMLEKDDEDYAEEMSSQVMDFVYHYGLSSGEQFSRRVDSLKVEFIPEVIQMLDVTTEFN